VALDAIRSDKTLTKLAKLHDVHPIQMTDSKNQFLNCAAIVFGAGTAEPVVARLANSAKPSRIALGVVGRAMFCNSATTQWTSRQRKA
jgi:hypothetical protein